MRKRLLPLTVFCLLPIASAMEQNAPDSTAAPTGIADRFVGNWQLVSWTRTSSSGETRHPFGEDAFGRIMYQNNGYMMVLLMRRDRPAVSVDEATPEVLRDIIESSFGSYTGRFTVDPGAGTVTHHIDAGLSPTWVGTDQIREFEFVAEDRIALRPPPTTDDGVEWESELIWQRER